MRCFRPVLLVILAAGLVLGACGPLPRPFKQELQELSDAFRQLDDLAGVVVTRVEGVPPTASAALSEAMVKRFHEVGIPASTSLKHRYGHLLTGVASLGETTARGRRAWIKWNLADRRGRKLGGLTTLHRVPRSGWPDTEEAAKAFRPAALRFASETVPKIARLMRTNADHRTPAALPSMVAVDKITGAPGDGGKVLPIALRTVLRKSGMRIADDPARADLVLSAAITVEPSTETSEKVRIVWRFHDRQGKLVRRMRQNNRVPKGRLSQPWGPLAYDIAVAMRDSVGETLASLPVASSTDAKATSTPSATPAESVDESPVDPGEALLQRLENTQILGPRPKRKKPGPERLLDALERTRIDIR